MRHDRTGSREVAQRDRLGVQGDRVLQRGGPRHRPCAVGRAWSSSVTGVLRPRLSTEKALISMDRGRSCLAGLVPSRRRTHQWNTRPQGRHLLRRGDRSDRPPGDSGWPTARPQPVPRPPGGRCARACCGARWRLTVARTATLRGYRAGARSGLPATSVTTSPPTPSILMRIFQYPAVAEPQGWGVAEHTDYGLLTLLHQDHSGGLQVHTDSGWIDVDPVPGALVCNLGDMLERMTGGLLPGHTPQGPGATRGPNQHPVLLRSELGRGDHGTADSRGQDPTRRHGPLGWHRPLDVVRHLRRVPGFKGHQGVSRSRDVSRSRCVS